jgi:hypothetical protein
MTRMLSPVSLASFSLACLEGLGAIPNAAFNISNCLALIVVLGPRRFPSGAVVEDCPSSLPCFSLSELHAPLLSPCSPSGESPSPELAVSFVLSSSLALSTGTSLLVGSCTFFACSVSTETQRS